MQVIGLCRFSYPGEGGFQVEHRSIEDRIAYLYQDARLAARFAQFEAITLPGLKAQTDPDFTFVIVIGESLPPPWRARLEELVSEFPQAQIQIHPPGPHRKVTQAAINAARHDMEAPCLQFRHDDDDAVAVDFVARLRQVAQEQVKLLVDNRLVAIDFVNGFAAQASAEGLGVLPQRLTLYPMALGVAVRGGVKHSIMNFAHKKLGAFMPVITRDDPAMFIRGHNDHNDSRQKDGIAPIPFRPMDTDTAALFERRFAIREDHVRQVFSGL